MNSKQEIEIIIVNLIKSRRREVGNLVSYATKEATDALQAYCNKQVIEELERQVRVFSGEHVDDKITNFVQTVLQDYLANRIKELKEQK